MRHSPLGAASAALFFVGLTAGCSPRTPDPIAVDPAPSPPTSVAEASPPASDGSSGEGASDPSRLELDDVLTVAREALEALSGELVDYTATFVKRERGDDGEPGPESIIELKCRSRLRNETDDAPRSIFLRFVAPESVAGRKVLWVEGRNDGQMAVHEVGFLLNLKTIWLQPDGMIAMRGQKHPVWEIGIVRLIEKLVERGEALRGRKVVVTRTEEDFDGVDAVRYRIEPDRPAEVGPKDFSIAEVVIDPVRHLALAYRSFDWPDADDPTDTPEMIESYEYRDVKVNVGLSDEDFDVANPALGFPTL